jgi:hypothetical protein
MSLSGLRSLGKSPAAAVEAAARVLFTPQALRLGTDSESNNVFHFALRGQSLSTWGEEGVEGGDVGLCVCACCEEGVEGGDVGLCVCACCEEGVEGGDVGLCVCVCCEEGVEGGDVGLCVCVCCLGLFLLPWDTSSCTHAFHLDFRFASLLCFCPPPLPPSPDFVELASLVPDAAALLNNPTSPLFQYAQRM